MKKKSVVIIAVIAVVGVGGFFVYKNMSNKQKNAALPVPVEKTYRDTIITEITAKGEVTLLNNEQVYSNTVAEVTEVLVENGDVIKKGDPLIRYDTKKIDDLQQQLREAQLNLKSAELSLSNLMIPVSDTELESARLDANSAQNTLNDAKITYAEHERQIEKLKRDIEDAERTYNNAKTLYDVGSMSKSEFEDDEKAVRLLKEQLETLESQKQSKQQQITKAEDSMNLSVKKQDDLVNKLDDSKVKNSIEQQKISIESYRLKVSKIQKDIADFQKELISPVSGTVTKVNVFKGEVTPTEKILLEVSDLDDYIIKLEIKERSAPSIKLKQEVTIKGAVLGKETYIGTVTKISPIAETKSTSNGTEKIVPIEVTMDKSAPKLKPGYSMEATIVTGIAENVVVIPILSTLNDKDGNTYVFVVKEDNTLEKRIVDLGVFSDLTVEATGIEEGEKIVSQPMGEFTEGMMISPIEAPEEEPAKSTETDEAKTEEGA